MPHSAKRLAAALVLGIVGASWGSPALAWGDSGHRTVCAIAFASLTPTARAETIRLLGTDPAILGPDRRNADYGWACTYPDHPAQNGPQRRSPEHYVNYPRTLRRVTVSTGCAGEPLCVLTGIASDHATLRNRAAGDRERHAALVYLGHWLGDIHQPLHASFRDDQGGNQIAVTQPCRSSLHSTWDTCIFQLSQGWDSGAPSIETVQTLAANWNASVPNARRAAWLRSAPWQWAAESYSIARARWTAYCVQRGRVCRYSTSAATYVEGAPKRSVSIDQAYRTRAAPVIRERMTRAGVRLAHWLNRALDPAYRG